jgi:hypothetical protein
MVAWVLICGGGVGWLVRSAQLQREAVEAIRRIGGHVSYDYNWDEDGSVSVFPQKGAILDRSPPWWRWWLRELFGDDLCRTVLGVYASRNMENNSLKKRKGGIANKSALPVL